MGLQKYKNRSDERPRLQSLVIINQGKHNAEQQHCTQITGCRAVHRSVPLLEMDGKAAALTLPIHSRQQSAAKANEGYKPFTAKE